VLKNCLIAVGHPGVAQVFQPAVPPIFNRPGRDGALRRPRPRAAGGSGYGVIITISGFPRLNGAGTAQRAIPTRQLAFTLIELMLVMALLTIVIAVSAPSLSNFFRGRTLDSEARRFVSLTRYGQSRAVSEGIPMTLWIDTRRGTYGLRQEPGYTDQDTQAVDLVLGPALRLAVADLPGVGAQPVRASLAQPADPNIATLRFQPDGFIDPSSPRSVVLSEDIGDSIWITQTRNRLNYEIHTNTIPNSAR